jgi:hypothetical protein
MSIRWLWPKGARCRFAGLSYNYFVKLGRAEWLVGAALPGLLEVEWLKPLAGLYTNQLLYDNQNAITLMCFPSKKASATSCSGRVSTSEILLRIRLAKRP